MPWHDAVLVAVCAALAIAEALVRTDLPARLLSLGLCLWVVLLLPFRRRLPFAVFCAAFGVVVVVDIALFAAGVRSDGLYTNIVILVLPYALCRWGAGRDILVGLGLLVVVYVTSVFTGAVHNASEAIGSAVVLLLPAAIGTSLRFRATAQQRALDAARAHERERLARDLHDTVAHHVSAIVIQAQAGRLVGRARPDVADNAFATIEAEGARALTELRTLVGLLRDGDVPLSARAGIADLQALARRLDDGRVITVRIDDAIDVDTISPTLQATLFRIAQESVTNALRHARNATTIAVRLERGVPGFVRLVVDDDGAPGVGGPAGFGIVGMRERARMFGGTLDAGRTPEGWRVVAVLPERA